MAFPSFGNKWAILLVLLGGFFRMHAGGNELPPIADSVSTGGAGGATFSFLTTSGTPSTSQFIPVRFGQVDAVTGSIRLTIPLGPKLPGRIPLGFTWAYDSDFGPRFSDSGETMGGFISPVLWPTTQDNSCRINVFVNGSSLTFLKSWGSTVALPSVATFQGWLTKRHATGITLSPTSTRIFPSEGGTSFLAVTLNANGVHDPKLPMAIVSGSDAIWTSGCGGYVPWAGDYNAVAGKRVTYMTNLYGDRVSVTESFGFATQGHECVDGAVIKLEIADENHQSHRISLAVDPTLGPMGTSSAPKWLHITNGMGFPAVEVEGAFRVSPRTYWGNPVGSGTTTTYSHLALGIADTVFALGSIATTDNGVAEKTTFQWSNSLRISGELASILHPNGLVESFGYDRKVNLACNSFSFITGAWVGFHPSSVPDYVNSTGSFPNYLESDKRVSSVSFTGPGLGSGQLIKIANTWPVLAIDNTPGINTYTWTQPKHSTIILTYPTSTPGDSTPFRGVRLTHPNGAAQANYISLQAYLFATSAILQAERIHGTGLPTPVNSFISTNGPDGCSGWTLPSSTTVDQTTVYDGWDLRCWANPKGNLISTNGIPVSPRPTRIVTLTPGLPTTTRIMGDYAADNYGFRRTDTFTDLPTAVTPVDPTSIVMQASVQPPAASRIQQTSQILDRGWDATLGLLLTKSEQKTLTGQDLSALRGVPSVNMGITTSVFDDHGRPLSITGSRENAVAVESRSYAGESPIVTFSSKTLALAGVPVAFSGKVGLTRITDDSTAQLVKSETDTLSGRTTTVNDRDDLFRVTHSTDPDGVETQTDYDEWGRVKSVKRLAKGSVGALTTHYTYNTIGRTKTVELVTADADLTTVSHLDAFGRVIQEDLPDGRIRKIAYDGFGQKVEESPGLLPLESYRSATWTYDPEGRVSASYDPQGRRLSSLFDPKDASRTVQKPAWDKNWQGVVSAGWDEAGFLRLTIHDLLGQKKAVVDQKGQLSRYGYDRDGNLVSTDQGGQGRQYRYNDMGWLLSRTEPEEGSTLYADHTILGLPQTVTQVGRSGSNRVVTRTALDTHHRVSNVRTINEELDQSNTSVTVDRSLTYPNATALVPDSLQEIQPYGVISETYQYDDILRLIHKKVTDGQASFDVHREFYDSGALKSLTYPSGGDRAQKTVTVANDGSLRPKTVTDDDFVQYGKMDYDQPLANPGSSSGYQTLLSLGNGAATTSIMVAGELAMVTHGVKGSLLSDYGLPDNVQENPITWFPGGLMKSRGADTFQYDELKRLSYASTQGLNAGETLTQSFAYDRYGNRQSSTATHVGGTGGIRPDEPLTWTAAYDPATNSLPSQVAVPGSNPLLTGAKYDDLGRLSEIWAIPGQSSTFTAWDYDAMGRVVKENGKAFLLDGDGLRFKRINVDGSTVYTVYGFNREPLSIFDVAAPAAPAVLRKTSAASTLKVNTALKSLAASGGGTGIIAPVNGTVIRAGYPLKCSAKTDVTPPPRFTWDFGDGGTAVGPTVSHIYTALGEFSVECTASGDGGRSVTVIAPPAPVIASLSVDAPGNVSGTKSVLIVRVPGAPQTATISWGTTGVLIENSIDQGLGSRPVSGTVQVSPSVTTTYTLTSRNLGGVVKDSVTVRVLDITSFASSLQNLTLGGSASLSWNVQGGIGITTSLDQGGGGITILPMGTGNTASSGTLVVRPLKTTTYTLTASCAAGTLKKTLTVGLNAPIISEFKVAASRIALGSSTLLSWNVAGAANIRILANGIVMETNGVPVTAQGSLSVQPRTTTTYTLEATNASSMMMATTTVDVVAPPVINGFGASPATIVAGYSGTVLNWNAFGYDTLTIQGIGTVTASGILVNPSITTTYTLVATNIAGTVSQACTVKVVTAPIIRAFTASPLTLVSGKTSMLLWDVAGADTLSVLGASEPLGANSVSIHPSATTTYTLTGSNAVGSASASITVKVVGSSSTAPVLKWTQSMVYGFGQLLAEIKPSGTTYIQSDQVGSPTLITDANGKIIGCTKNLPFGERFGQKGAKSMRRFTNHEDQDGSAIYMQARMYLPAYGKFGQVDPAYDQMKDDPETWNLYNYVTNNPVTSTDPDGRRANGSSVIDNGSMDPVDGDKTYFSTTAMPSYSGFVKNANSQISESYNFYNSNGSYIGNGWRPLSSQAGDPSGQGSGAKADGKSTIAGNPGAGKTFDSVTDALAFGYGWIKDNFSKPGGMDVHEYGFKVYSEDDAIRITPIAQGPTVVRPGGTFDRGTVNLSITSAGLTRAAMGLAEAHTHPLKTPANIALGMQKLAPSDEDRYRVSAARHAASGNYSYMSQAESNMRYSKSYYGYLWRQGESSAISYGP